MIMLSLEITPGTFIKLPAPYTRSPHTVSSCSHAVMPPVPCALYTMYHIPHPHSCMPPVPFAPYTMSPHTAPTCMHAPSTSHAPCLIHLLQQQHKAKYTRESCTRTCACACTQHCRTHTHSPQRMKSEATVTSMTAAQSAPFSKQGGA